MNAKLTIKSVTMNGTVATVSAGVYSPLASVSINSVKDQLTSMKFCATCTNSSGEQSYGIFKITSVVEVKLSSFTITAECINGLDQTAYKLTAGADAVVYSTTGMVDDVPSGTFVSVSPALTEWLRTENLSSSIAATLADVNQKVTDFTSIVDYSQIVTTANIPTDTTADKTHMHPVVLDHKPTADMVHMEINGIEYNEDDDSNGGDFVVDRTAGVVYVDAFDDNFSFTDMQKVAKQIRINYRYKK